MFAILLIISLRNPCVVTCHHDISINNGHLYNGSRNRKILSLSDILTPWHKARFLWCDDAGVKPTALPSLWKYSTYHYVQYITLDGDKPPWYWFMYLLYYAFYHYFWTYSFDLQRKMKVCCKWVTRNAGSKLIHRLLITSLIASFFLVFDLISCFVQ